ncbi:MAG: dihydrodipicolinate synthase family protein [Candidatus Aminicenantes bacterium]|nr:MAG: dihydrodipicolinate synthase family protein [Candidatus Aminicenantes bacterium]
MNKPLEGVYVALTTPFSGDGIAAEKLKDNVRKLNATAVAGYLVLGSTGESVSLTDAESLELVDAVLEAAAPEKKVLVGTAREWTQGTIDFTASLPARGIAAVLVRPPSYFKSKMTREALRAHYLAVADASRYPVLVYNMPQNTGISLEPRLVIDLSSHPNIAGLKESGGSLAFVAEVVREVPDRFHYLLGSGSVVYPGLEMGACGAILAVANAVPEMAAEIFRLFKAGKKDEARELQLDLIPFNKTLVEIYGIAGLKHAQDLRGYHGGPTRLPLLAVDEKGKAEISALLKKMGL